MTTDFKLYMQGFFAKLIQASGWFSIIVAFILLVTSTFWFFIYLVLGIGLIIYGKAKHFEYKRKAGLIVYRD